MKNIHFYSSVLAILLIFNVIDAIAQNDKLAGNWTGKFMGQFDMQIEFLVSQDGTYSGTLRMFDGQQQIQNDLLTRITVEGTTISFYIEAKSTTFVGNINQTVDSISGEFIFPDGSRHLISLNAGTTRNHNNLAETATYSLKELEPDQLKSDVFFLRDKMKEFHPSLQDVKAENEFSKNIETAIAYCDHNQTVYDFYTVLAPVTSSVNCSHTGIRLPFGARQWLVENGRYLPLKLLLQSDKIFLISSMDSSLSDKYGKEILKINDKTSFEIINELFSFIPSEQGNMQSKYFELNSKFNDYFVLIDNSEEFMISFNDNKSITIPACSFRGTSSMHLALKHEEQREFPITFTLDPEAGTGYLEIPTFGIDDIVKYIGYMDSIFTELNACKIENLVVDLRGNAGGHPIFAAQLFSYLAKESFTYFDSTNRVEEIAPLYFPMQPNPIHFSGNNYFLIDGGCLSTTGHLISLVKYYKLGTFIGEEPGSFDHCNDGSKQFVLPNSGIELNVPTLAFRTATSGFNKNTVVADYQVSITPEDLVQGTDPYITAVQKLILDQKSN